MERRSADARSLGILIVGFGCLIAFSRMLSLGFVGYFVQGVYSSTDAWYLLRTASAIAALAVLALAGRFRWFSLGGKSLALATAVMVASTIVFAVDAEGALGPVVAMTAGASNAVVMFAWFLLLACYSARTVVQVTLPSLVISWALVSGAPYLDSALALIVAVACAFVAGAAAFRLDSELKCCTADGVLTESEALRVPWLTVVTLVVCGLYAMVLYAVADQLTWLYNWSANVVVFDVGVFAVVVGTAAVMIRSESWMYTVWVPMFSLVAIAIVLSCLPIREAIEIAAGFILAAVFCAHFLYWMVFPAMLSALRVPRVFLAGMLLVLSNGSLASSLGNALASVLPRSMQSLGSVAGMMAIVLCAIFAITFVANRHALGAFGMWPAPSGMNDVKTITSAGVSVTSAAGEGASRASDDVGGFEHDEGGDAIAPADADAQAPGGEGEGEATAPGEPETPHEAEPPAEQNPLELLKARLDTLSEEYGLTPREKEIAFFTVQGFSCAYIAEKLVVSNSTVRFHQQNLYRKFDVHSRNELIEFVNGSE